MNMRMSGVGVLDYVFAGRSNTPGSFGLQSCDATSGRVGYLLTSARLPDPLILIDCFCLP